LGTHPVKSKPNTDPFSDLDEEPAAPSEEAAIREDLVLLDQELRDILAKPPKDWDLSSQFTDLRELKTDGPASRRWPPKSTVD